MLTLLTLLALYLPMQGILRERELVLIPIKDKPFEGDLESEGIYIHKDNFTGKQRNKKYNPNPWR